MLINPAKRVQDGECLIPDQPRSSSMYPRLRTFILICPKFTPSSSTTTCQLVDRECELGNANIAAALLRIYSMLATVPKHCIVHIPFCAKRSQPSRPQARLTHAHLPTHARCLKAISILCWIRLRLWSSIACLEWCGMSRDRLVRK